ncbi:MAG TPA: ATP-binding cassette domain-containing protein, partial [Bradyrhizobium sp.]|nr:ATP-binding cassette domain-containing protein [Bradyrhizobium sp.]
MPVKKSAPAEFHGGFIDIAQRGGMTALAVTNLAAGKAESQPILPILASGIQVALSLPMQTNPAQLSVRNVRKSFYGKAGEVGVLDDLSFSINERDFVSIIGPSGCGKTTIFNIIAGLLEPDSGTIH